MEYRGTINLFNIVRGVGMLLKIDPQTQRTGPYSRVQVNVDCSKDIPEKILVQRKNGGYDFFVNVSYEFVPHFCHWYGIMGYKSEVCRNSRIQH